MLWALVNQRQSPEDQKYRVRNLVCAIFASIVLQLYPPGQDHLLDPMRDKKSGFPLDCYKYNRLATSHILFKNTSLPDLFSPQGRTSQLQFLEFDCLFTMQFVCHYAAM